ncbi:MAG: hypothetical protein ABSC23_14995, partial [Bryobacteraceae bacterium]
MAIERGVRAIHGRYRRPIIEVYYPVGHHVVSHPRSPSSPFRCFARLDYQRRPGGHPVSTRARLDCQRRPGGHPVSTRARLDCQRRPGG